MRTVTCKDPFPWLKLGEKIQCKASTTECKYWLKMVPRDQWAYMMFLLNIRQKRICLIYQINNDTLNTQWEKLIFYLYIYSVFATLAIYRFLLLASFFYGYFFYGLNASDRKKRNRRKNDRKRRNRLRDIEGSNTPFFTVTFLRSNFFITHPAVKEGTGVHWRWTGSGLEIYRQWAMI